MSAPRWLTTTGMRGCVWTLRGVRIGGTWTLGTHCGACPGSTEVPRIQFIDFVVVGAELEYIIMRQTTEAFGGPSFPGFARVVRTWKMVHLFLDDLVSGSFFLGVWVLCMWITGLPFFREMTLSVAQCLVRRWFQYLVFYVAVDSTRNPGDSCTNLTWLEVVMM